MMKMKIIKSGYKNDTNLVFFAKEVPEPTLTESVTEIFKKARSKVLAGAREAITTLSDEIEPATKPGAKKTPEKSTAKATAQPKTPETITQEPTPEATPEVPTQEEVPQQIIEPEVIEKPQELIDLENELISFKDQLLNPFYMKLGFLGAFGVSLVKEFLDSKISEFAKIDEIAVAWNEMNIQEGSKLTAMAFLSKWAPKKIVETFKGQSPQAQMQQQQYEQAAMRAQMQAQVEVHQEETLSEENLAIIQDLTGKGFTRHLDGLKLKNKEYTFEDKIYFKLPEWNGVKFKITFKDDELKEFTSTNELRKFLDTERKAEKGSEEESGKYYFSKGDKIEADQGVFSFELA